MLDLAADHGLFALGGRILPRLHHVQRADDGRQRVAQLVAEHGEEFVLGARGVLRALQLAQRRCGSQLGKGLAVGFAEPRFFRAAQDVAVQRVGQREHVARPAHDGHGDGRLVHQVVTLGIGHAARAAAFGFGQATAQLLQKLPVTSTICGPMMGQISGQQSRPRWPMAAGCLPWPKLGM